VPAIAVPALQKDIAAGKLAPLYLIFGEDVRLAEALVDAIEATIDEADRPFAAQRVYATEPGGTPIDIAASARVMPMLGDRRLVVVLRAEKLLKPKRAAKAAETADESDEDSDEAEEIGDLTPLEDYIAKPVESSTLVFVAAEIDRGRRFTKRLVEKALVAEVGGMTRKDDRGREVYDSASAARQAEQILRTEGRTIDPAALDALVKAAEGDINKLRDDISKVVLFAGTRTTLTADDVGAVASGDGVVDDWAVTNAIGDGDAARALTAVAQILERGDSPHQLIGQLRWWVSNRMVEGAPDRVKLAIDAILRTDRALKRSGGDERVLLERLVVELTGKKLPPGRRGGYY
jgi:DNA polymerase-3 subunit delta